MCKIGAGDSLRQELTEGIWQEGLSIEGDAVNECGRWVAMGTMLTYVGQLDKLFFSIRHVLSTPVCGEWDVFL